LSSFPGVFYVIADRRHYCSWHTPGLKAQVLRNLSDLLPGIQFTTVTVVVLPRCLICCKWAQFRSPILGSKTHEKLIVPGFIQLQKSVSFSVGSSANPKLEGFLLSSALVFLLYCRLTSVISTQLRARKPR
jgi:hypothetical protein